MNIELKAPRTDENKLRYQYDNAASAVYQLTSDYNMHGKFLISSFSTEVLRAVEHVREQHRGVNEKFDIIYLYNEENCPLPHPDHYTSYGDGINISANHINEEVVKYCKNKGLKVGVWISKKDFTENDDFYHNMFNLGVDFIVVDQPLKAMEARTIFFENSQ